MILKDFILNYKKAFGEKVELPLAFWYSDYAIAQTDKKGQAVNFIADLPKFLLMSLILFRLKSIINNRPDWLKICWQK